MRDDINKNYSGIFNFIINREWIYLILSCIFTLLYHTSLEGLMLNLKLQYFGHLMCRTDSLKKTLVLGKIEGRRKGDDRGWAHWKASLTQWTWVSVNSRSWWWTGRPGVLQSMGSQRVRLDWLNYCVNIADWITGHVVGFNLQSLFFSLGARLAQSPNPLIT